VRAESTDRKTDTVYGAGAIGLLYSGVFGQFGGHGIGGEASYTYFPSREPTGFGGFVQRQAYPLDSIRTAVGAQFVHSLIGAELGWAYRSAAGTQEGTHGLHLAPFVSIGFLHVAPRGTIAFRSDDRSWGTEFALTVGLKTPFQAPNFPDYINMSMPHGRALRVGSSPRPRLARVYLRDEGGRFARGTRSRRLARWLRILREEHASVTTFARLTEELAELGAPPKLVTAALAAAVEEHGHAEEAMSVANHVAGCAVSLGPLPASPPRHLSLEALVVESYFDGCIGEEVAAEVAQRAGNRARSRLERRFHELVAREERSHAKLAWSILRWGLETSGASRTALSRAVRTRVRVCVETDDRDAVSAVEQRARRRLGRWLAPLARPETAPRGDPALI